MNPILPGPLVVSNVKAESNVLMGFIVLLLSLVLMSLLFIRYTQDFKKDTAIQQPDYQPVNSFISIYV